MDSQQSPQLQLGGSSQSVQSQRQLALRNPCSANRLSSSPLCGQCAEGYVQWQRECVKCDDTKGGLIVLLIVAAAVYVAVVHVLAQAPGASDAVQPAAADAAAAPNSVLPIAEEMESPSATSHSVARRSSMAGAAIVPSSSSSGGGSSSSGDGNISHAVSGSSGLIGSFTYFVQVAQLQSLGARAYIGWLGLAVLAPQAATGAYCLTPLSPLNNMAVQVVVPLLCMALLAVGVASLLAVRTVQSALGSAADGWLRWRSAPAAAFRSLQWSRYGRTLVSLLLFSFQPVVQYCLAFFHCVSVGGARVVYLFPQVNCDAAAYRTLLPVVILVFIGAALLLPLFGFLWLYRRLRVDSVSDVLHLRSSWSGVLYDSYRPACWWFAFVQLAQRMGLAVIDTFLLTEPAYRPMAFGLADLLVAVVHVSAQPFNQTLTNKLHTAAALMLVCVALVHSSSMAGSGAAALPFGTAVTVTVLVLIPVTLYAVFIGKELRINLKAAVHRSPTLQRVGLWCGRHWGCCALGAHKASAALPLTSIGVAAASDSVGADVELAAL